MGKIECTKYPRAVWNSISREQQVKVRKLSEQQGIKPTTKQISEEARIAALEARINSHFNKGDAKQEEETTKEPAWGRNKGNFTVTCQALGGKHKELG